MRTTSRLLTLDTKQHHLTSLKTKLYGRNYAFQVNVPRLPPRLSRALTLQKSFDINLFSGACGPYAVLNHSCPRSAHGGEGCLDEQKDGRPRAALGPE
jgi:hypothetical protein